MKADLYQQVTDSIISIIEAGQQGGGMPFGIPLCIAMQNNSLIL